MTRYKIFQYRGNIIVYYILYSISKIYSSLFLNRNFIVIYTPYGKLILPKSGYAAGARVVTLALDVVEPQWKYYFERVIREADWFLDVGAASDGYYTLKAVKLNPRIQVIAVEPLKTEYYYLVNNLSLNGIANRVKTYNIALCDETKEVELQGEKVKCETLETLMRLLPKGKGVIKLDVEGNAYMIIKNFTDHICKLKPVIFLEVHNIEESRIPSMLKSCGYRDIKTSGDMHILTP